MIKVFGVGNKEFSDDGIGIKIIEHLRGEIESLKENINIETGSREDKIYFENLNANDFLIIVDSGYFGKKIGGITNITLSKCDDIIDTTYINEKKGLVSILRNDYREVKGIFIAIEILSVEKQESLSCEMEKYFNKICSRVLDIIKYWIKVNS